MDGMSRADFGLIAETASFLCYFSTLPDARQAGKVVYPLDEVLLLSLLAVLAGADSFAGIARFGEKKLNLLRRFLPFVDGTPPHDTLGDIFATLDAEAFQRCFVDWVARADQDGCRSHRHRRQDRAPVGSQDEIQSADPYGLGLRRATTPRAGADQGEREVERDRRHPGSARHDGDRGSCRHHRRHGLPA